MDSDTSHFRAILQPNHPLSRKGFTVLMVIVALLSLVCSLFFLSLGAWPVCGFFGLDVALLYWAFRLSFRASAVREFVEVNDRELVVAHHYPGRPVRRLRWPRAFVRVELEEDRERELVGRLLLCFRHTRCEIGAFLAPEDRRSFAHALRGALASA